MNGLITSLTAYQIIAIGIIIVGFIIFLVSLFCSEKTTGGLCVLVLALFLALIFLRVGEKQQRMQNIQIAVDENWDVYINGTEVDIDTIELSNYSQLTFDRDNNRVLIAVE